MRQAVFVKDPHVGSLAARVLLAVRLRRQELDEWFSFRASFMRRVKKEKGSLRCHYCGKDGLVEDVAHAPGLGSSVLATIDHVVPVSKGGPLKAVSNLVVACYPCNQRKADGEWPGERLHAVSPR
jgi:5-methylcytosine-specific restriction endonuclease McrA